MKNAISLLLALIFVMSLAACGGSSAPTDDTNAPAENTQPDGAQQPGEPKATAAPEDAAAPENEPYGEVAIQNGDRTITFTEMPTGVLCCHLYAAENMVMLGLTDYIAAKNVPGNAAEVPLPELAADFEGIPEIERSHENAVASGADLVIGQVSAFKDSAWGSYEMFEDKNINCYTISGTLAADETIENVYEDIAALGKIFKVEDRADALIQEMKDRVAAVQEAVSGVAEEDKVHAFVMDSFNGNEIYTTAAGLQSNLIELAGGVNCTRNMADSRWFTTSVETLVETDPDVIIFNDYGSQTIEEKMEFVNNNPALQDVTAVKNQNYIVIPLVSVMQDIRAASACETFARDFYPDCFEAQ